MDVSDHKGKVLRALVLFLFLHLAMDQGIAQDFGSGFSRDQFSNPNAQQVSQDTLDRPPLKYSLFSVLDWFSQVYVVPDTLVDDVHMIEPFRQSQLLESHLGSEQSARYAPFVNFWQPLYLGSPAYDPLLESTARDELVSVNRSFFQMHYANGQNFNLNSLLGSSHVDASFYRSFSKEINFNFDYQLYSDDGNVASQNNRFERLDIKLFQNAPKKKRHSYLTYSRPQIEESVNPAPRTSTGLIALKRREEKFAIGNQIVLKDSVLHDGPLIWQSEFAHEATSYDARASLSEEVKSIALLSMLQDTTAGDSLIYYHSLKTFAWTNRFRLGDDLQHWELATDAIYFSDDILGAQTDRSFFFDLRIGRQGQFNDRLSYHTVGQLGLLRSYAMLHIQMDYESPKLTAYMSTSVGSFPAQLSTERLWVNSQQVQSEARSSLTGGKVNVEISYKPTSSRFILDFDRYSNFPVIGLDGLFVSEEGSSTSVLRLGLEQSLDWWIFRSLHKGEYVRSSSDAVLLPQWRYTGNIHIPWRIFRKMMFTHWGLDVQYVRSFDTPSFYPVAGHFYNDRSPSSSGEILIVSPYLNAQVGAFSFFVKSYNSTALIKGSGSARVYSPYELVAGFPLYDYRFRFGVKWTLLD